MNRNNIIFLIIGLVIMFFIMRSCEGEPKVITKTETKIEWKTDTITVKEIVKQETPVYVERVITKKGKDSIIYRDKPTDQTIEAQQYETKLTSNQATTDLKITSLGEVLDVQGTITYPEKETITTITKTRDASGLFIYGASPVSSNAFSPELGLLYQFKNKMFISTSVQYNNTTNNVNAKVGIGVKLW